MRSKDTWNRCDCCGRFISMKDFETNAATRHMITPDSHFSRETYETLCKKHAHE
jgi:hypothetical protein